MSNIIVDLCCKFPRMRITSQHLGEDWWITLNFIHILNLFNSSKEKYLTRSMYVAEAELLGKIFERV
jgi:hypothetical protein